LTNRALASVALCIIAAPADACRCPQRNLAEYFEAAREVVTAKLISSSRVDEPPPRLALQFELLAPAYKSSRRLSVGGRTHYTTSAASAACGIQPEEGAVYVLFAYPGSDGGPHRMQVDSCSGSRVLLATDSRDPAGFQDVPARFVAQQLNALGGLEVLRRIADAQPTADDPQNDRLVGLLDVSGFSHAGHALLLARPERGARQMARLGGYDGLAAREVGYETPAAVVYARVDGWYRLRTAEGEYGWLPPEFAGTFFSYADLPVGRLAYLPLPWHGFLWPSPGAGLPVRVIPPQDQREQPVEVLESARVGGALWFRIRLLRNSPCEDGSAEQGNGGWIPAYRDDGAPAAWFYARGC